MTSHAGARNGGLLVTRNELAMPKWVTEQTDRIGPKPPPPPVTPENVPVSTKPLNLPPKTKQPEPDYEVIEFSNQQYSNTPLRPNSASSGSKTPDNKLKCTLCGSGNPWVTCDECAQQLFCASCDDMFHKHPKRKGHQRKTIDKSRPPLPPKVLPGQSGPTPPVAPPRRNKRGFMTPIMQRKDQGNTMTGTYPDPATSPTPSSKSSSLRDRIGSLPRGLNLFNRPLPETPKTPSESSRSTTPKSVFDNIQRPPSVALEKIKSKANATLDRMQILQERYRQQKEQMERERSGSVTDQNMSAFDQWSSISQSPSHFRSGSISSGINSSHLDFVDDNNFNLFHQHQMGLQHHHAATQRANQLGQRGMSSSVFNLNQMNGKQPVTNSGWVNNSMQQAQSMAQLNCGNCGQHQLQWNGYNQQHHMRKTQDPWSNQLISQQHLNRSNMSLNAPAGFMMQPQLNNMYPPPAFMNQRNFMAPMYPQPYLGGMPIMNPGLMCMPPSTSRAVSRAGSRLASPAMSRKSVTLRRKQRSSYIDGEATDDEDSDEDDSRSITSIRSGIARSRQRRISSASQFQLDDDIESTQAKLHRNRVRSQRRESIAKSVHNDWAPGRKASSVHNNRSADSGFNSPLKPSRIYSDLDSEGSGTRALVQAKIEQKLKEESLRQKQSKSKRQSKSPPPQKTSSAVQTPAVKLTKKNIETYSQQLDRTPKKLSESETEKDIGVKNFSKPEEVSGLRARSPEEEEEVGSGSESENKSELSDKLDVHQEMEENANPNSNEIQEDELGPPPSTPDHEWECEFCTFVNEANIKICSICCKTPTAPPKKSVKTATPPKQLKTPTTEKENECRERLEKKSVKHKSGTIKKSPLTSSTPQSAQRILKNEDLTPEAMNDYAQNANSHTESSTETFNNKESVQDVWDSLDGNIQATANEITLKAQSKKSTKEPSAPKSKCDLSQSQIQENGSPPSPQNISTQTYDTLPAQRSQARSETISQQAPQPSFDDVIQHTNFPSNPNIQDLRSFEAEVLNNIHNISHIPPHSHNHQRNHPAHFYNERQRYRSSNDLRMDDTLSVDFDGFNGLKKGQLSISELMMLQKTSSQTHSPYGGSIYDLPYHELSSIKSKDMENHKESDLYKHTTEELNAAIKYCGPDTHPLVWLRDNWPKLIQTVQSLATKYGQERAENTIGTISQMEAREALRMHTGNIWQAVSECIEQRQRKYREISSKGNFSREDIVTALTTHQGNVESALFDLGHSQLKPFLMRIWGSPGGVENESGFQPLPKTTSLTTQLSMDKDIHNFLRENASDCMQIPNSTGANLISNQTPSPYDRPDSFKSPFESINHTFDNASSYSTDSRITAHSPLQLDGSIFSNKNVLKDLETLIGNMEQNQQKQNENVLRSIHSIITNKSNKSENAYDSETMRILTKSPIVSSKLKASPKTNDPENDNDIKSFVWQHIQEIMPNLVQQVELELVESNRNGSKDSEKDNKVETTAEIKQNVPVLPPPPIDQDEFLMEEVIKPNIKKASIREELPPEYVYAAEIETFKLAFDKALGLEHEEEFEFEELSEAPRKVYQMFVGPKTKSLPNESQLKEAPLRSEANSQGVDIGKPPLFRNEPSALTINTQPSEVTSMTKSIATVEDRLHVEHKSMGNNKNQTESTSNTLARDNGNRDFIESANNKISHYSDEDTSVVIEVNKFNEVSSPFSQKASEIVGEASKDGFCTSENRLQAEETQPRDLEQTAEATKEHNSPQEYESETTSASSKSRSLTSSSQLENQSPATVQENSTISSNEIKSLDNILNLAETQNEENSVSESSSKIIANKRISKIPVRRSASNKSLVNISNPKQKTKTDVSETVKPEDFNVGLAKEQYNDGQLLPNLKNNVRVAEEPEDKEFYSIDGNNTASEVIPELDQTQFSTAEDEMFFTQAADLEGPNSIAPSTSNSTLHSIISHTSSFKPSSEFIPSGDPSKQNLTELVKDTQRLIQQMKDEISIDEFESSTDDELYSDEFSDDYDDDEEDDWEEVEGGDEEDEADGDGDGEEYDDLTEDLTEENEAFSIEEDSMSKTQTPLPSVESQDQISAQYSSAFSPTLESLNHSFSNEHFEQDLPIETNNNDTNNQNTTVGKTAAVAETENVANNLENSLPPLQFIESENNLSDLPVEIILSPQITEYTETSTQNNFETPNETKTKTILNDVPIDQAVASAFVSNELILENTIPELPVEVVLVEDSIQTIHEDIQDHARSTNHDMESNVSPANNSESDGTTSSDLNMVVSIKTTSSQFSNDNFAGQTETPQSTQSPPTEILKANDVINSVVVQTEDSTNENVPSTSSANNNSPASLQESSYEPNNAINRASDDNNKTSATSKTIKSTQIEPKASEAAKKVPVKKAIATSRIPKPKEVSKEKTQKEAPKQQNELKKKSYTRSKSFSGPTAPIGISSVKAISQKFTSPSTNIQTKTAKKQQPTVTRKSSIVEAINKFTKPSSSSEKPAVSSLFKSRTQHRIPKKKYHETCFSDDDYESSSEEGEDEMAPLEIRKRKLSVPVFKAYPSVQEPDEVKTEELIEKFMKEELAKTVAEAQIAATLVSMKFAQDVSLWAAKECSDLDHAIALLKQDCELCSGTYALNQIVSMLKCTHKCCKQCAKTYFTVQITERSINDCSCPFCKLPELHNQNEHEDENLEYFSNLDIFLKNIVEPEVHELFQRKLRDRTLLKDPNFKWCVQCSSGFFARPKQKRLICPDCGSVTCAQCRKTWQKQHEGISCEQFSKWESANDPEVQAKGVQQHLEHNGIDCPKCKFKYSLARGGCMHFTCTQCKFEFCYGCAKPFMMGAKCTISPYCAKLGLHAHHPRNCLFYLRDKLPVQLQILLKNNNVPYEVDPIEAPDTGDDNEPSSSKKKELLCPIAIQKETPTGLVDTRCKGDVPEKHAGMCRNHYVEYLTVKVARAKIDPLPIFDLTDCVQELRRRGFALPERGPWDTDEIYKNMCAEVKRNKRWELFCKAL